jgi:small subunit ribosomal protein S21
MTQITLEETDRVEWALKAFRRLVQRAGILKEVRQKRHYLKPSVAKRLKAEAAARRKRSRRGRDR